MTALLVNYIIIFIFKDICLSGSLTMPPDYNQANRQLGRDIAPLPSIHNVLTESYKEGNFKAAINVTALLTI